MTNKLYQVAVDNKFELNSASTETLVNYKAYNWMKE